MKTGPQSKTTPARNRQNVWDLVYTLTFVLFMTVMGCVNGSFQQRLQIGTPSRPEIQAELFLKLPSTSIRAVQADGIFSFTVDK